MQKDEEIVRVRHGRQITIRKDVQEWRRKMRAFKRFKAKVLNMIAAASVSPEEVKRFFSTPHLALRNRTPQSQFAPKKNLRALYYVIKNWIDNRTKLSDN